MLIVYLIAWLAVGQPTSDPWLFVLLACAMLDFLVLVREL